LETTVTARLKKKEGRKGGRLKTKNQVAFRGKRKNEKEKALIQKGQHLHKTSIEEKRRMQQKKMGTRKLLRYVG